LDTLEVLLWGALVGLVIVVGIEILGDAVAGDRVSVLAATVFAATVLAATVLSVDLAELSASTEEFPGFEVFPLVLGARLAVAPEAAPFFETTGVSLLLLPMTCVLPDAVVILLRGCTDCGAEFRLVAVGCEVMGGKPPSLLFGELPAIPRGAGLS